MLTSLSTHLFLSKHWTKVLFVLLILTSGVLDLRAQENSDSTTVKKKSILLSDKVDYNCDDSTIMDWVQRKAYLYNNAYVKYEETELKAAYIEIDFEDNTIYATGLPDSNGVMQGTPIFKDGADEYETSAILYNTETKKGIVFDVTRQEGDFYTKVEKGKKMPDNIMYVDGGHFTTCSDPHPHFRIKYNKAKVIPNDKIVTGPITMEIADVTLPLPIPFGYFPNKRGRANGIVIPSYGYSDSRGYYLTKGGYYTGLGEQMDLLISADIYSKKSWGLNVRSNYNVRYKYQGYFDIKFADYKSGETDTEYFNSQKDFKVIWQHRQSNLANPNANFSADVQFGTKSYNKLNAYGANSHLSNSFSSNISYTTRMWGRYNLSLNAGHSQNNSNGAISVTLPSVAFSTPRYTPLKEVFGVGKKNQLQNLTISYRMNAKNQLTTIDSIFMDTQFEDFKNGIDHSVPISLNLNYGVFNWNNTINYREKWYFQTLDRHYQDTIFSGSDTIAPGIVDEMVNGFRSARAMTINSSVETRIYGMFAFKNKEGPVKAVRHVMNPSVGFSYTPDLSEAFGYGYYQEYIDANGESVRYSIFGNSIYGGPPDGRSGRITASIGNNLEMKVRNRKDSLNPTRKIKLIESLNIGTSYDITKDSLNLAPLSLTARTTLFKGMSINYAAVWDFYEMQNGTRINQFVWENSDNILRKESGQWRLAFQYSLNPNTFKNEEQKPLESNAGTPEEIEELNTYRDQYVDFNIPWNFRVSYDMTRTNRYNSSEEKFDLDIVQAIRFSGDINITDKWKFAFNSGYDIKTQKLTYTTVDIYRDLHCWEMLFSWVPLGITRRYELTVRVKAPALQDLKLNRKREWRDY